MIHDAIVEVANMEIALLIALAIAAIAPKSSRGGSHYHFPTPPTPIHPDDL